MEFSEIQKRLNDLRARCEKNGYCTSSCFMTPSEVLDNRQYYTEAVFSGGYEGAERQIAVFIPEWMDRNEIDINEYISCLRVDSFFGTPSHRDYMGAVLGLGISRDRIGDIIVDGDSAFVFCLPSVETAVMDGLSRAGRVSVKVSKVDKEEIPEFRRETKVVSFTVKSMRLDAVCSDLFRVSRTAAAEAIKAGLVSLNYTVCEKTDAPVKGKDIISMRGKGKGTIVSCGGKSRRDRLFVTAELFI